MLRDGYNPLREEMRRTDLLACYVSDQSSVGGEVARGLIRIVMLERLTYQRNYRNYVTNLS